MQGLGPLALSKGLGSRVGLPWACKSPPSCGAFGQALHLCHLRVPSVMGIE